MNKNAAFSGGLGSVVEEYGIGQVLQTLALAKQLPGWSAPSACDMRKALEIWGFSMNAAVEGNNSVPRRRIGAAPAAAAAVPADKGCLDTRFKAMGFAQASLCAVTVEESVNSSIGLLGIRRCVERLV
jgi:hypothetical protein